MKTEIIKQIAGHIAPSGPALYLSSCTEAQWHSDVLHALRRLTAENEKLLAQRYGLGRFISQIRNIIIMRGDITSTFESTLKEVSVAIFDICNDALAKLKESE